MKKIGDFVYRCCFWSFVYAAIIVINAVLYSINPMSAGIPFLAAIVLSLVWFGMWIARKICRYNAREAKKNEAESVCAEIETNTH